MGAFRSTVKRVVPKPARDAVRAGYWGFRRWEERSPQQIARRRLLREHHGIVPRGPFAGMRCLETLDDGCLVPKLLGCYEEEIHAWIEALMDRQPRRVIDVGCASGWYTTGFAMRLPAAEVFGFDLDPDALRRARQLADLNGVSERVTLRQERLTPTSLGDLIDPDGTLVFVDIDGPELELLDPSADPRLLDADVLVEFHDHFNPEISRTIVRRYQTTHEIRRVHALGRDPAHYPELHPFRSPWVRNAAVAERRPVNPRQEFAVMFRDRHDVERYSRPGLPTSDARGARP